MKVREERDPGAGHGQASWCPVFFGVWTMLPNRTSTDALGGAKAEHQWESGNSATAKQLRGLIILSLEKERRLIGGMRADFDYVKVEVPSSRWWISFIIKLSKYLLNVSIYKVLIWQILTAHRFCARHCPRCWGKGLCLHGADIECIMGKTANTQENRE